MAKPPMKVTAAWSNFQAARQTLESFRHEHMGIFEEYDQLCNAYNEALSDAKKLVGENAKKLGKSYGDFKIISTTAIDVDSLVRILGEDKALDRGYVTKKYSIKRQTYDTAVKKRDIPQDVVDVVEIPGGTQIRGPKPVGIYSR